MMKKQIVEAVKKMAMDLGYTPYCGFAYRMNAEIKLFPVLWYEPLMLTQITGRSEGTKRYKMIITAMEQAKNKTPQEKNQMWERMEDELVEIYKTLGQLESVAQMKSFECKPAEFSLTNHGEISCSATLVMEIYYCNK